MKKDIMDGSCSRIGGNKCSQQF